MSRAIIADRCAVSNAGLGLLLSDAVGFTDVEHIINSSHLVGAVETHRPFLLIINVTTIGVASFSAVEATKELSPRTRILIFDNNFTGCFLMRFLRLGIDGYCTDRTQRNELYSAFRHVLQGKRFLCRTSSAHLLQTTTAVPEQVPIHETFSEREMQIFLLLGAGKSSSEIAGLLNLSRQAVSTYKNRICRKSNLKSAVEISRYIRTHRLDGLAVE